LHTIDSLAVGGAERELVELANQAKRERHRVAVCVTRSETTLAAGLDPGIDLWVLGRQRRFDFAAMRRFARLVDKSRIDLVQANSRSTLAFLMVLKTLRMVQVPIIFFDNYGKIDIDTSVPWWFRWWGKYSVSHYVGACKALGEWARAAGLPPQKISVIENGLDLAPLMQAEPLDIRKELNIPPEVLIGIVVGGLRHEKGTDVLIEAVAHSPRARNAKILVVGGSRDHEFARNCREQASALGLEHNLLFMGQRLDVPHMLRGADFALMPSRSEAFNLVFIEYLASALPFVSTLAGGVSWQLAALGLPEFVPINDPRSFASALDRLLTLSPAERRERGKQGQAVALEHFDIRTKMPHWYRLYDKVLGVEKT
jgi:glycosyltransferase involved in cell wall biosynthesis